jgi:hypothetical protein
MKVSLNLSQKDANWLKKQYGEEWLLRLEQHIHGEIHARQERSGWYDEVARRTGKSAYKLA